MKVIKSGQVKYEVSLLDVKSGSGWKYEAFLDINGLKFTGYGSTEIEAIAELKQKCRFVRDGESLVMLINRLSGEINIYASLRARSDKV